jgi:hypothetical protein
MILVPRQLQRAGMTGNVPYYGGRFTPAQAYAASHPQRSVPVSPPAPPHPREQPTDKLEALRQLHDAGVITSTEYQELRERAEQC